MTDDTVTGWRTRALRAWAWLLAHPDYAWPAAAFVAGVFVGWVLL